MRLPPSTLSRSKSSTRRLARCSALARTRPDMSTLLANLRKMTKLTPVRSAFCTVSDTAEGVARSMRSAEEKKKVKKKKKVPHTMLKTSKTTI